MNTVRTPSWRDSLAVYLESRVLILFAMGFSSGLPLLLVFGTLSFWLREADVSLTDIGYMSWVALAYGFKWLWSPLVDRLPLPLLSRWLGPRGRRMPLSHILVAPSPAGESFLIAPAGEIWSVVMLSPRMARHFAPAIASMRASPFCIPSK